MLVRLEGGGGARSSRPFSCGGAAREGSGGASSGVAGKTGGWRYDLLANGRKRGFVSRPSLDAATAPTAAHVADSQTSKCDLADFSKIRAK
jgi:hypothetical protein